MSKLTGSAQDILKLVEDAQQIVLNGDENPGTGACLKMLASELNTEAFKGNSDYDLKISQLQKTIYNTAKKLVKQGKGHLGLTFISPYLNRLSQCVYGTPYEKHYGKFTGVLFDIKQGIEKIPSIDSSIDNNAFLKDLKQLGITGTANKLSSSQFEPRQCIEETKHSLFFMGLLGSKWVEDIERFKDFLRKVQSKPYGRVRYLMINPKGESFKLLKTMRGDNLKDNSTEIFRQLADEFECLETRFYDFLPCFRLIFIDGKILAASRYKLDESNYLKSKKGWEAPHLVIDAEQGEWSLFEPFLSYYETIWKHSTDISEVIIKKNNNNGKSKNRRDSR
jgi:hypothetical protein